MHLEYQSPTTLVLYDTSRGCPEVVETFTDVTDVKRLQASLSQTFGRVRLVQAPVIEEPRSKPERPIPSSISINSPDTLFEWEGTLLPSYHLRMSDGVGSVYNITIKNIRRSLTRVISYDVITTRTCLNNHPDRSTFEAELLFTYGNDLRAVFYHIKPYQCKVIKFRVNWIEVYDGIHMLQRVVLPFTD